MQKMKLSGGFEGFDEGRDREHVVVRGPVASQMQLVGVFETPKEVAKLVLAELKKGG